MLHTSGVVVNIKKALYEYDQDKVNCKPFQRDPHAWYQCIHFVDSQDGKISYEEFEHMCTIFPKVLNPIRHLLFRISPTTDFILSLQLLFPAYRIQVKCCIHVQHPLLPKSPFLCVMCRIITVIRVPFLAGEHSQVHPGREVVF